MIEKGTKDVLLYGETHEVGCPLHRGRQPLDHETRIDPATGKDRRVPEATATTPTGEQRFEGGEVAQFPVYGDDVGFDPECVACRMGAENTRQHAEAKRLDREQAAFEQREHMRQRLENDPDFAEEVRSWLG